jgi:myo-inositol 2-dehydrogenase/D-chiro-inositol 1-dehydrogenase
MGDKKRIGVIGVGRIGSLHARLLHQHPDAEVVSIADVDLQRASDFAEELGVDHVTDDPAVLIAQDLDAVVIASSTDTHASLICEAARAGRHIFCEKPVDLTVDRIHEALAEVEKAGVMLQIGFNRRFDRDFRQVRDRITSGQVGETHMLRITSRDPSPPPVSYVRVSGGLFLDMMIHDFDMARFLVGDEVDEIYATGASLVDPAIGEAGDVDTAVVVMRFRNGTFCTIDNSRRAVYGYDQRAEVLGDRGCALTSAEHLNSGHFWDESAEKRDTSPDFFIKRYMDAYQAELDAFVTCLCTGASPEPTGLDGLRALELGLAARASLLEKKTIKVVYS